LPQKASDKLPTTLQDSATSSAATLINVIDQCHRWYLGAKQNGAIRRRLGLMGSGVAEMERA
jgi:hypothetical protein